MASTPGRGGAPQTQQERRDKTRARLIDATITSIADHGYPATTTRQVAELAEASLGALAHHFPARIDLITTALDEVGRRMQAEIRDRAMQSVSIAGAGRTPALLDALWTAFTSDLYTVWVKVWIAAADDPELYTALAALERPQSALFAAIAVDTAPKRLSRADWTRRFSAALDAMRGLALTLATQPRATPINHDPWPDLRRELTQLLDR
ncbi:AcrR family transcriptional regulator [Mycobacterium sp. MAA66]|uniref:TetR/AcrR family transcriptional regulator n=1 Tax=Mycobacterium sp. MAA66 TaxID=3156297 RepID=UPI003514F133